MEYQPFTKEQAIEISEDFEDIIGTRLKLSQAEIYRIENVIYSPLNESEKVQFVENYKNSKDQEAAIAFYGGEDFDVILFVTDVDDRSQYFYFNIRTYVGQQGINYRFPVVG